MTNAMICFNVYMLGCFAVVFLNLWLFSAARIPYDPQQVGLAILVLSLMSWVAFFGILIALRRAWWHLAKATCLKLKVSWLVWLYNRRHPLPVEPEVQDRE